MGWKTVHLKAKDKTFSWNSASLARCVFSEFMDANRISRSKYIMSDWPKWYAEDTHKYKYKLITSYTNVKTNRTLRFLHRFPSLVYGLSPNQDYFKFGWSVPLMLSEQWGSRLGSPHVQVAVSRSFEGPKVILLDAISQHLDCELREWRPDGFSRPVTCPARWWCFCSAFCYLLLL